MARKPGKKKTSTQFISKTPLMAGVAVAILILLAGGVWAVWANNKPAVPDDGSSNKSPNPYVNLSPATSQEKQDSASHKQASTQPPSSPTVAADGRRSVTPIITNASQNTVDGYISGVFEDGGTCTATLTNASTHQAVTKTSQGFENASYTSCTPMKNIVVGSGTWQVVLSYSSSTSTGSSSANTITVP